MLYKIFYILIYRMYFKDLTWQRFWRLIVLKRVANQKKNICWECVCDCWIIKIVQWCALWRRTFSCWCLKKDNCRILDRTYFKYFKTHWLSNSRIYKIFTWLRWRCTNINNISYANYGWRWIKCLWMNFIDFMKDMYDSYKEHISKFGEHDTTIDRINNDWDYCKENCRRLTRIEQNNNMQRTKYITYQGETKTIWEWSRILWLPHHILWNRFYKGWSITDMFTKPIRK